MVQTKACSVLVVSIALAGVTVAVASPCRCLYGDDCWPDFSSLSTQLSQPLIRPVPPESACYPSSSPSGNCTDVIQGTTDGNWRANQSGSMQSPNFETFIFENGTIDACYLNTTLDFACKQGSVPVIGVDARSASDIQAAVKFVNKHNLRLVVKNTGHDFLGRSTARGSFLIWTHNMKNITYNASFVPDGALPSETYNAITLDAGVQWHEAYDAIQAHGRVLVGGLSAGGSVGAAGGWLLGGGHSALSPKYGLGVDNVLQFTVVTSPGDHITLNSHQYSDLFWALRGGGGGTYGIVTSVTYLTHPSTPLTAAFFSGNSSNAATVSKLENEFVRLNPSLSDAGWSGYAFFLPETLAMIYIATNISSAQANATIDPFFAFAQNLTSEGLAIDIAATVPFDSFYSWYKQFFTTGSQVGANTEIGSRLFSREVLENDHEKLADLMRESGSTLHLVAGGAVSDVDPESTGLNPAWRSALVHVTWSEGWPDGTQASVIEKLRNDVKSFIGKMEALEPGSGSYFNEASLYEEDPKRTFFGSHYPKLEAIKTKYDPHGLFVVAEGVGSDEWDSSLNCRR